MAQCQNCVLFSLFWEIKRSLNCMCLRFGTPCSIFTGCVMEQAECSETSAQSQAPEKYPKRKTTTFTIQRKLEIMKLCNSEVCHPRCV